MPLKVLCAGCPKDEREPAEAAVRAALGQATGSWTVSLVKIGPQWSVTVDGPEIKHKTAMVPAGGIRQAILEMLPALAPGPALPPFPPIAPMATPTATPAAKASGLRPPSRATGGAAARAPLPPTKSAPAPVPRTAPTRPASPVARSSRSSRAGEQQDRYDCQYCGGAFVVIYESGLESAQETVAVACPHCWKNSHVMVAEEAALSRDYRAEKV